MPTWTGAGADNNWSTGSNWDTLSAPTAAQPAIFDGVTGLIPNKNVIITAGATCSLINFTGYSGQLNIPVNLTVAGAVTLSSTMTSTGTGNISKTGSGTMTSNGHVFSGGILISAGLLTLTWADNWNILNYTGTNLNYTTWSGAFIVSVRGDAAVRGIISIAGNITTLRMSGTGVLSNLSSGGNPSAGSLGINININTAGTITLAGSILMCNGILTYTQGNFDPAGITFQFGLGITFDTDRTGTGGGKMTFFNLTRANAGTGNITLTTDLWMSGSLSNAIGVTTFIGTGRTIYVGTNLGAFFGDITIELNTSTNGSILTGTHGTNIVINKTGGASVSLGTLTFITAGRTLSYTAGIIDPLTSTVTVTNNITINGWTFWNLTIGNGFTITQNTQNIIQSVLTCSGSVTFAGTRGFTTQNFTCTTAASIITFQNINANPLAEYRVNGVLTLLGTLANRITLQAAGSASFNGTITPVGQLNYLSGTSPSVGMTVSQATGFSPTQLNPANRPVITGGASPTFTIAPAAGGIIIPFIAMRAGYKAKFVLTNNGTSSQNVTYVTTQDIDSSDGVTILSFGSNGDDINNSTIALFRTLNWGPLVAPSGSVYYTFVT